MSASTEELSARLKDFLRARDEAAVEEVRRMRHGVALLTPSLPLVWALNQLRVDDPNAHPGEVIAEAEEALAGYPHRRLLVLDAELGERLAGVLTRHGWNAAQHVLMVRRREPDRVPAPGSAAEVDRATGAATLRAFRREQPYGWQDEAVRQLAAMDERYGRACGGRDFGAPPGGPVCACRLYAGGGLAQIDEVGTLRAHRGLGHARATVHAAAEAGLADGNEIVFLEAEAHDWPQDLYRRLGFDEVGRLYQFLKPPPGYGPR